MFKRWLDEALEFAIQLRKIDDTAVRQICVSSPIMINRGCEEQFQYEFAQHIPQSLLEFYASASSCFGFTYEIDVNSRIYGGPDIIDADRIDDARVFCKNAAEIHNDVYPETENKWENAFPLIYVCNGDLIALDCEEGNADPPVVYLCHDEEYHYSLADSLMAFLIEWQKIKFIGPEIWELEKWGFIDGPGGSLDVSRGRLSELNNEFAQFLGTG